MTRDTKIALARQIMPTESSAQHLAKICSLQELRERLAWRQMTPEQALLSSQRQQSELVYRYQGTRKHEQS